MKGLCIVNRLQAEELRLESEQKQENFHLSKCSDRPWGPQPPCSKGVEGCFPRIQRSGRLAVRAPPSIAKVKYEWNNRTTPHYVFMASYVQNIYRPIKIATASSSF